MADFEQTIVDGFTVGTGLLAPTESDSLLMASIQAFPDNLIYDPGDIQRLLDNNRWKLDEDKYSEFVRNQEQDGQCNCSANASGVQISALNQGFPVTPLSASFLYQLLTHSDTGTTLPSTFQALGDIGISPIEVQVGGMTKRLPNTIYSTRTPIRGELLEQAKVEAKRFRAVNLLKVPVDDFGKFKIVIATMLARKIPIVWAWHVGKNGTRIDGNGYMIVEFGKQGNHANLLVSAKWVGGSDIVHPVDMNSWGPTRNPIYGPPGPSWGRRGFAFATMEQVFSCAQVHQPYGIISINVDSNDSFYNDVLQAV